MKLEMLHTFQITAEQGSLSLAAAALGRTPSAVSMTLSQLESHIGGALFETERKNRLTPLGALVLAESRRATEAYARATSAIRSHTLSTAGTVRIAAVPSATTAILPRAIAAFRQSRPDVRLEISDLDSSTVRQRVQDDQADIGILSASPDQDEGTPIWRDALGILCHKGGPIAAQTTPPSWEMLHLEPLITNPLCHLVNSPDVKSLTLTARIEARNTSALLAFVRAGLGATILPASSLPEDATDLIFLAPTDPASFRDIRKIRHKDSHPSPVAAAFWDAL